MVQVIWTDKALDDLDAIVRFVAQDSPDYAERLGMAIVEATRRLHDMPLSGRKVPGSYPNDMREIIHGAYRIVYLVRQDGCHVVAVIHSSRDFARAVHREDWPK